MNTIYRLSLHLQVLLPRSTTDLSLFVEEVEHAAEDGQQQDTDDDNCNDDTAALWWGRNTSTGTGLLEYNCSGIEMTVTGSRIAV